jgi:hypothetical protein
MAVNRTFTNKVCFYSGALLLFTLLVLLSWPTSQSKWFVEFDLDTPWWFVHTREDHFHFVAGRTDKVTLWTIGPLNVARAQQFWDDPASPLSQKPLNN